LARRDEGPVLQPSGLYSDEQLKEASPTTHPPGHEALSTLTTRVRTTTPTAISIASLHRKDYGLKVSLGIWLSDDLPSMKSDRQGHQGGQRQSQCGRPRLRRQRSAARRQLKPEQIGAYILRVKKAIRNKKIEIGYADRSSAVVNNPRLPNTAISSESTCCPTGKA